MKSKSYWKTKARRWLVSVDIINGFNGMHDNYKKALIEDLAKTFEKIAKGTSK